MTKVGAFQITNAYGKYATRQSLLEVKAQSLRTRLNGCAEKLIGQPRRQPWDKLRRLRAEKQTVLNLLLSDDPIQPEILSPALQHILQVHCNTLHVQALTTVRDSLSNVFQCNLDIDMQAWIAEVAAAQANLQDILDAIERVAEIIHIMWTRMGDEGSDDHVPLPHGDGPDGGDDDHRGGGAGGGAACGAVAVKCSA